MSLPSDKKIKEIAELASKSRDLNSAWVFGFSELARYSLEKIGLEEKKKMKALQLFESGFVTNLYREKTSKVKINHAERINNGLNLSKEFLKKELDNPYVERFSKFYSRSVKTGKKEVFMTSDELQTFNNIFKKSLASVLEGKNKDFYRMMSYGAGKLILELEKKHEKNRLK